MRPVITQIGYASLELRWDAGARESSHLERPEIAGTYSVWEMTRIGDRFTFRLRVGALEEVAVKKSIRRQSFRLFGAAMLVAAGAFWATMFTSPPTTEAGGVSRAAVSGTTLELFSVTLSKTAPVAPAGPGYDAI